MSYAQTRQALDASTTLSNKRSYRLVKVDATAMGIDAPETFNLDFEVARYFDGLDTTDVLAYESARRARRHKRVTSGPYRSWLGDPFDLSKPGSTDVVGGVSVL